MKKLKLFISLWFTMFSIVMFGQAEYEKIAITQNTQDNTAGRLLVQDVTTGEVRWILKSILDNKFNQPTGDATQYLDGAGNPTTFPVLSQSDRVITEVRNSTGATITKGTVVYLNGATGGKPNVQKAQANAEATSSGTFGVIQSDINNNSNGYVVVIGTVLGLNTSAYSEGQVLWLSPTTAGGFTTTKPVAPNHAVYVGIVTLAATQGTIEVKIQNGYELDEIHDVLITSKTDNDGLIYESSSGLWKNKQITKAMVGLANVDNTSDLNKPISTATQTALNLKENTANKNTANGYAGLGSDGKLISSQLPAITITDTFVVGSQALMLALTAETGDVAVRTDVNKSFILKGTSAGTLADWQELLTPTSSVTSVFGRQGAVTANNGDYTTALVTETTNKRYQTDIQQTYNDATSSIQSQLNAKEPSISAPGTTGSYWRGNKTFATLDTSVIPENGSLFFTNDRAKIAVTGNSGSINYVSKFTSNGTIGNSQIFDNGTNVGIGTVSPDSKLHVAGNIKVGNALDNSSQWIGKSNSGAENFRGAIKFSSTTTDDIIQFNTHRSGVSSDIRMTIDGIGNVGIGNTNPSGLLHLTGNSGSPITSIIENNGASVNSSGTKLRFQFNGVETGFLYNFFDGGDFSTRLSSNGYLALQAGGAEKMIITSGGNVGIGTGTPFEKLHIQNGGSANTAMLLHSFGTEAAGEYAGIRFKSAATAVNEYAKGFLAFRNNGTGYGRGDMYFCLNNGADGTNASASDAKMILTNSGNLTTTGSVTATSFVKSGGTSSQYLMADGSVKTGPGSYKVYTALLNQTGTNAPTATVLENTLGGTIVWSYVSIGQYRGTLTGAFLSNKTVVFLTNVYGKYFLTGGRENDNSVMIGTQAPNGGSTNGDLSNSSIEIRVYN